MQFFAAFKSIIPEFHAFSDEDKRYNIGATWTDAQGLRDHHNLELRYVHNSERLALQGDPQPDGSWKYVEPNGNIHVISPERAKHFIVLCMIDGKPTFTIQLDVSMGVMNVVQIAGVANQRLSVDQHEQYSTAFKEALQSREKQLASDS